MHTGTRYSSRYSADIGTRFTVSTNLTYTNNVIKGEFVDAYANQSSGSFNSWFHRDLDMAQAESIQKY